jgi:uncharacterized membrane protein YtjA (UPF0391 family)
MRLGDRKTLERSPLEGSGSLGRDFVVSCSEDVCPQVHCPPDGRPRRTRSNSMLYYAIVFLIIALIAGFFGFFGVAGLAATIAKILFIVFIILFILSLIFGRGRRI